MKRKVIDMARKKVTNVKIDSGELQGIFGYDPRITVFKGVPYAKPPVGELRWRAPQPVEPWEGVRVCSEYGPISMQKVPGGDPNEFWTKELHPAGPEFEMGEDCLYLNVFTPARNGDEKLPVLVYIHGGGLTGGYPYEIEFDWEHMARKGIVVVTVAYRLGMLGFLSHPWLSAESPDDPVGCYGYLDQLEAIKWTKRNIAVFGGDPDRITIAGQSAGAGSVMTQLSTPMGKGLISGAIVQSGVILPFKDLSGGRSRNSTVEDAEKAGEEFFEKCGFKSLEEARACPAQAIFDKAVELGARFSPPIDGKFLCETSTDAMINDHWGDIPVIFGYNSGEIKMFNRFSGVLPQTLDELNELAERYGSRKEEFLKLADCKTDEDVKKFVDQDGFMAMVISAYASGQIRAKQGHKAYLYEFDHAIPGEDNPGVYHGAELPFAYDALARMWRPYTGKSYDMARIMSSYWVNFISTGDPNGVSTFGEELPRWDPCTPDSMTQMIFTDKAEQVPVCLDELMKLRCENNG